MDIEEIYQLYVSDTSILTLEQLSKRFGFGSKRYLRMCKLLYDAYGKDEIKSISNKRLSQHRLKIRNSKLVKYSDESKRRMSNVQKSVWLKATSERRALSATLMKLHVGIKGQSADARKKSIETRRKNGWPGLTDKWRESIKLSNIGRIVSDETRAKMRLSAINRMNDRWGQISPNYNPTACQLFEQINKELGWSGQHAENGGEFYIKELGYWVDYYEPNLNIVIEYDEEHHTRRKEKDKIRQQEIERHMKCKFIRVSHTDDVQEIYESCRKATTV